MIEMLADREAKALYADRLAALEQLLARLLR